MKLQGRLLAAGIVLILAVLSTAAVGYWHGRQEALRDAEASAEDLARALEQHTTVVVRGVDRGLAVLLERIDMAALHDPDRRFAFHQLLDRWARADPTLAGYLILDENGVALHRSVTPEELAVDHSDRPYFKTHRDNPVSGLVIEPVVARSGPLEGRPMITFSRRLSAPDGRFAGVVVAAVPIASLQAFYESLNVGRNGVVSLLRRDGVALARSPAGIGVIGQRFDKIELFQKYLPKAEHGTYRSRFVTDNVDRITAYRSVPSYPLLVTVSVAEAEVMAAWHRTALIGAAALLLLAAVVALLLIWLGRALKRQDAAARALAMNEAKARSTLETVADGVIAIDARGIIQSFNPAAERMFGYTASEAIGQKAGILSASDRFGDIGESPHPLQAVDAPGRNGARREIAARRSDGRSFPADLRLGYAPSGAAAGDLMIATVRDLTEEKALRHQFEQSQKLEAIGHLTGGIAHDFGNILAGIAMNLEMVVRRLPPDAPARTFIDDAVSATRSGKKIVQRLLAFAHKQPLNPSPGDLNTLVQEIMPLLRQGRGPGISIETRLSGGLATVYLDRSGIENALLNLVINANDAMPDGGAIVVETGRINVGASRAVEWGVKAGEYATLSVRDSGIGMTEDVARRIFEPFFSTKGAGRGTGLGLSMVQGFVLQSGGHILVDSKPDAGTRVTMLFPMQRNVESAASSGFIQLVSATLPAPAGRTILVVEDDVLVRSGTMQLIHELGHRPIEAGSAEEALAQLEQNEAIELMLTDIGLPGMNGKELARVARARRPGLKVLFATGYDMTKDGAPPLAEVDASTGLLMKPFFAEDLEKELGRLLGPKRQQPEGDRRDASATSGGGAR